MTRRAAAMHLENYLQHIDQRTNVYRALTVAISALREEGDEDLISRKAAQEEILKRMEKMENADVVLGMCGAAGIIFDMPSARTKE